MNRYFYKIVDQIDFVWKIEINDNDPYQKNSIDYGHFVCNKRQFIGYSFESVEDIEQRNLFTGYQEIIPDLMNDQKCYYDNTVGLLHQNDYWQNLHAVRYVNCLDQMSPVVFGELIGQEVTISDKDRKAYVKLMNCDKSVGDKIYTTAFSYFKSLADFDPFFAGSNLDTLEKFLPTLTLQAIYLKHENEDFSIACVVFRPSWDEELGLAILLNLHTMEVKLYED